MATYDDVKTWTIAIVGAVATIVVFGLILLLEVVYYRVAARQLYDKEISQTPLELAETRTRQQARLFDPPGWRDRKTGQVHVPIDLAMDLVVRDLASGPGGKSDDEIHCPAAPPQKPATEGEKGGGQGERE